MDRNKVDINRTWKLEDIFSSDTAWSEAFALAKKRLGECDKYNGKLTTIETIADCLKLIDEISLSLEKLYVYARMRKDENSSLDKYVGYSDRIEGLLVEWSSKISFVSPQLSALSDEFLGLATCDKLLSDYDYLLKEIKRNRAHILSEKEEKLLSLASSPLANFQDVFSMIDNVELPLPTLIVAGKRVKLSHGEYSVLLQSSDQAVRKRAFEGMYKAFQSLINTIAACYGGSVKKDIFYAGARGYVDAEGNPDCLTKALFGGEVPRAVYDNLITAVEGGLKYVHQYVAYRKKALGGRRLNMYDMYVPLCENADYKLEYDDAYALVVEALQPLGKEYVGLLLQAKADRWIDVEETTNKRSGAYSWGVYGTHPYVLLNYTKTTHDVFTIAHEMGHALHSYYSDLNLPYNKAGYAIFVAEVASTVNEVLLLKHLIATEKDENKKKYLLTYYLDMFRTTLFRQTMFAEFEKIAHEMAANDEPLTSTSLSDKYYALNKKYYGKSVFHNDLIKYEWARIPHFYNSFYVYQYATGLTSAVAIARNILNDGEKGSSGKFVAKYKQFLSAGGHKSPYEILCDVGIDLATEQPYEVAIAEFADTLAQLERLG